VKSKKSTHEELLKLHLVESSVKYIDEPENTSSDKIDLIFAGASVTQKKSYYTLTPGFSSGGLQKNSRL
jgi:hypothetical protein